MCHFHQQQIINRYITRKPKLKSSIDLKKVMSKLSSLEKNNFDFLFSESLSEYLKFLQETTISSKYDKRLMSSVKILSSNLDSLFIYKRD